MEKTLLIGFDLSLNQTGITVSYLEDNIGKKLEFFRVIFDDESNKFKKHKPVQIQNINDVVYQRPKNISVDDLVFENIEDDHTYFQCESSLKEIICEKNISLIVKNAIEKYKPDLMICCIENYVMPSFGGKTSLKNVGPLISLQSHVRKSLILLGITNNIKLKLLTPTPSAVKAFFSGNGKAEKPEMFQAFISKFDGKKLLPTVSILDVGKINDVVDSFALMMYAYSRKINNEKSV